jgi:hypothetical protein
MDGPSRVRLQKRSEIREIVSDIDQLKLAYSMSAIEILTPRAEVMLRLGNKSKICLKLCYHQLLATPKYSITLQYPMNYPYEPLEVLEIKYTENAMIDKEDGHEDGHVKIEEQMNEENLQKIQHLGQDYANSHTGDDGYSVNLISYLNSLLQTSQRQQQNRDEADVLAPPISSPSQEDLPEPFKCRSCRQILFYSCHIQHNPIHLTSTSSAPSSTKTSSKACTSIFLQELSFSDNTEEDLYAKSVQWIQELFTSPASSDGNGISGKITCPSCQAKLGSWSWSDAQCSCGKWFVPSLQFTVTKVDPPVVLSSKKISIGMPIQLPPVTPLAVVSLPFVGTMEELGLGETHSELEEELSAVVKTEGTVLAYNNEN